MRSGSTTASTTLPRNPRASRPPYHARTSAGLWQVCGVSSSPPQRTSGARMSPRLSRSRASKALRRRRAMACASWLFPAMGTLLRPFSLMALVAGATSGRASPGAPAWLFLGHEDLPHVALLEQFVGTGVRHHARRDDASLRAALDHQEYVGRLPAAGPAPGAVAAPHPPAQTPGLVCEPVVRPLLLL